MAGHRPRGEPASGGHIELLDCDRTPAVRLPPRDLGRRGSHTGASDHASRPRTTTPASAPLTRCHSRHPSAGSGDGTVAVAHRHGDPVPGRLDDGVVPLHPGDAQRRVQEQVRSAAARIRASGRARRDGAAESSASRTEIWGTPNSDAMNCCATRSGVSAADHMIGSPCTAISVRQQAQVDDAAAVLQGAQRAVRDAEHRAAGESGCR